MSEEQIPVEDMLAVKTVALKPSGIRKFFDIVSEMKDAISLGVGEPDFDTPWHIRDEGIYSLEKGRTFYTSNSGLKELREAIAQKLERDQGLSYDPMEEILITVGGSEAIDLMFRAMINPGDEVLIPQPSYVSYEPCAVLADAKPVIIGLTAENKFRLTPEALERAVTPKSKILVLPYPNNPTGAIMTREDLRAIAPVIREHNLYVLSDEIYGALTYVNEGKHTSIAEIPGMKERTVLVNGFSKAYAMTGWRLGFVGGPHQIVSQLLKLHQYAIMCSPTMSQYAAVVAMRNCIGDIEKMKNEYDMRRRFVVDAFNKLGLDCFTPQGAFYVFPCIKSTGLTSADFCEKLIYSKKVAVVPGDAFGACGEGFVRVSYAYSINHLKEAVKRIGEFLEELKNGEIQ